MVVFKYRFILESHYITGLLPSCVLMAAAILQIPTVHKKHPPTSGYQRMQINRTILTSSTITIFYMVL